MKSKMHQFFFIPSAAMFVLSLAVSAVAVAKPAQVDRTVSLHHVHGLAFSADGSRLMIPSHYGLALFENGRWRTATGPVHDYMGFSATRDTLYSSGHPAAESKLVNPFGLIKSRDEGKSWQNLGLEGESDFHILTTSYTTNAVYVVNNAKNSRMNHPGIHHTRNDGMKWIRAAAKGLIGQPTNLAAHPSDPNMVAAGTASGLFLSRNSGESFERLIDGTEVLSTTFDLDGKTLLFTSYPGKAALTRIALLPGSKAEALSLPDLAKDAIAYVTQNPVRRNEIAIASFKRSVFISKDLGRSWKRIAQNGETNE